MGDAPGAVHPAAILFRENEERCRRRWGISSDVAARVRAVLEDGDDGDELDSLNGPEAVIVALLDVIDDLIKYE